MFASYGSGRYFTGEGDWFVAPRTYKPDGTLRGVIYCHGAGSTVAGYVADPTSAQYRLIQAIGSAFPTAVCDLGGVLTWGNATMRSRVDSARAWLQGPWGAKAGTVLLVGYSMGGAGALNYAQGSPGTVAALAGIMPVTDIAEMYATDRGSYRASIGTAWGVTYPAPLPVGASPAASYGQALPLSFWTASNDTTALPAPAAVLAASVGGAVHDVGPVGHSGVDAVPIPDVLAFLRARAA